MLDEGWDRTGDTRGFDPGNVVLFAGDLNTGKSRLVNNLIGIRHLPDDRAVADTWVYSRVRHAETPVCRAVAPDGGSLEIDIETGRSFLPRRGSQGRALGPDGGPLDRIEFEMPLDLHLGVWLEDAPGRQEHDATGRGVRTDVASRAGHATAVCYLVRASVGLGATDAAFLASMLEVGVPLILVVSRLDEPVDDEDGDISEVGRNLAAGLRRWNLAIAPRQVHLVSSFWHEQGDTERGGVLAVAQRLHAIDASLPTLRRAQELRLLAAEAKTTQIAAEAFLEACVAQAEAGEQQESEGARQRRKLDRQLDDADQELRLDLSRAGDRLLAGIAAACQQKEGVQAAFDTTLTPTWCTEIAAAVQAANGAIARAAATAGLEAPRKIVADVGPLVCVFDPEPSEGSGDKLKGWDKIIGGNTDLGEVLSRNAAPLLTAFWDAIKLDGWLNGCRARAKEALDLEIERTVKSLQRRCDGLREEQADRLEADMDEALLAERHRQARIRSVVRTLGSIASSARAAGRHSSVPLSMDGAGTVGAG